MEMLELVDINMSLDFSFPPLFELSEFFFIISVDLLNLLNCNVCVSIVELIRVQRSGRRAASTRNE